MFKSENGDLNSQREALLEDLGNDWGNLKLDELVRGSTPADIEKRCFDLCATYIGGSWAQPGLSTKDVTVKRISGGLTNQLFQVTLNKTAPRIQNLVYQDEPNDVAIKFYMEKHMKNYQKDQAERLNDMIILTIMSQVGLGPKIYGIFTDGFIQGYYPHEQFRAKHQQDPALVKQCFTLCARINHLNVPISKDSNLLFKDLKNMLDFAYSNNRVEEIAKKLELKALQSADIRDELAELLKIIDALAAPQVFCHNDFRGSNLLVTEPSNQILACDLEYCGYGTRGFDLATVLCEWGKQELTDMNNKLPSDDEIRGLLSIYIEACDQIIPGYAKQPENSLDAHFREVKTMILANTMFFLSLMIKQTDSIIPTIPFDLEKNITFVDFIYKAYLDLKSQLIADGIIATKV